MNWRIGPDGSTWGSHSATDGDTDMAMALLIACDNFGSSELCSDAPSLVKRLLMYDVDSSSAPKPGDNWGGCDASSPVVNPSYFSPAFYPRFGNVTNAVAAWDAVKQRSHHIIQTIRNDNTGLVPDWSDCAGLGAASQCGQHADERCKDFYYDAVRTPWRYSMAAAWHCDTDARAEVSKLLGFFSSIGGPQNVREGYTVDGTPIDGQDQRCFLAMASTLFVHSDSTQERQQWWDALSNAAAPTDYFCASLRMVALLFTSGIMTESYQPTPPPSPPAPKFSCDTSTQQCIRGASGAYPSKSACLQACGSPPPATAYSCDQQQQMCSADAHGSFANQTSCERACSPNYSCSSSSQCVQNPSGVYPSYGECNDDCHPGSCTNKPWAQCGGTGWSGETCCPPGYSCVKQSGFYSQCCQGGACHSSQKVRVAHTTPRRLFA